MWASRGKTRPSRTISTTGSPTSKMLSWTNLWRVMANALPSPTSTAKKKSIGTKASQRSRITCTSSLPRTKQWTSSSPKGKPSTWRKKQTRSRTTNRSTSKPTRAKRRWRPPRKKRTTSRIALRVIGSSMMGVATTLISHCSSRSLTDKKVYAPNKAKAVTSPRKRAPKWKTRKTPTSRNQQISKKKRERRITRKSPLSWSKNKTT